MLHGCVIVVIRDLDSTSIFILTYSYFGVWFEGAFHMVKSFHSNYFR